jgi:hypothetical protein
MLLESTIPQIRAPLRQPISLLVEQIEYLTEQVEEITEAWQIALDAEMPARLQDAVGRIDLEKQDIPDWRDALGLIPDGLV